MTRPFTTAKINTEGVRGLREVDADRVSGDVDASISLDGFSWVGQTGHARRDRHALSINARGRIAISPSLMRELGVIPLDARGYGRALIGIVKGAIVVQFVEIGTPRALSVMTKRSPRSTPVYCITSRGALHELQALGHQLPIVLPATAYPKQLLIHAKLPQKEGTR